METLGSTTVICTDKTGTLTQNRMVVKKLFVGDQGYDLAEARQSADLKQGASFFRGGLPLPNFERCRTGGRKKIPGRPHGDRLGGDGQKVIPELEACPPLDEIPFDGDRKRLSTIHRTPRGLVVLHQGAPETLLPLCRQGERGASALDPLRARADPCRPRSDGGRRVRVLALAYRIVPEGYPSGITWKRTSFCWGWWDWEDPPRPEVPEAIRKCKGAGIKVIMVTGDHPHTAGAIARQIGLTETNNPVTLTGEQLRHLSDTQLQLALDVPEILFARVNADQKTRIVRALQAKKHVVAVTGDGVNDAPACGKRTLALPWRGRHGRARKLLHMVLMDDNFASIIAAIEEGRAVFQHQEVPHVHFDAHNVAELVPYLGFVLFRIPLPLTVMQILAVDLGTDTLPALGLGAREARPGDHATTSPPPGGTLIELGLVGEGLPLPGATGSPGGYGRLFLRPP